MTSAHVHTLISCNDKIFPVGIGSLRLIETDFREIPSNTTHVTWICCMGSDTDTDFLISEIKDAIESCCLLKSIIIVDYSGSLGEWLQTFIGILTCVNVINEVNTPTALIMDTFEVSSLTRDMSLPFVVSSLCYEGSVIPECVKILNICDTSSLDIHGIRALRQDTIDRSVDIYSINGLFYGRKENVFHSSISFVEHFTKMIHFAGSLNTKSIIFGSASSKYIQVSQGYQYARYKDAHMTFGSTMDRLAKIAAKYNITIYIKPNKPEKGCNYLFDSDQVSAMVQHIACPNVKVGPMRDGVLNTYDDFQLLEAQMSERTLEKLVAWSSPTNAAPLV